MAFLQQGAGGRYMTLAPKAAMMQWVNNQGLGLAAFKKAPCFLPGPEIPSLSGEITGYFHGFWDDTFHKWGCYNWYFGPSMVINGGFP